MSDVVEQYAAYFTLGLKITVCIPMENNELFRDWAIVETLEENIATLRLSRDVLPVAVHLIPGIILDLRLGKDGKGYRCSGFFVGEGRAGEIKVHLTGDVGTSELREFFRIEAFIPFRYQFTAEQNLDALIEIRRKRKQIRLADEAERREAFHEKHREMIFRVASGEFDGDNQEQETVTQQLDAGAFNPIDETWDFVTASGVNLSAGGFKFVTTDDFKMDDYVIIDMFIPGTPSRIMESITRVAFKNRNYSIKDGKEYFNVALAFVVIDDRDRDAIVSHISYLETLRNRQKRQLPLFDASSMNSQVSPLKMAIWIALLVVLLFFISTYFYDYSHQQNEIQDMFQNAVRKYRQETGQKW